MGAVVWRKIPQLPPKFLVPFLSAQAQKSLNCRYSNLVHALVQQVYLNILSSLSLLCVHKCCWSQYIFFKSHFLKVIKYLPYLKSLFWDIHTFASRICVIRNQENPVQFHETDMLKNQVQRWHENSNFLLHFPGYFKVSINPPPLFY